MLLSFAFYHRGISAHSTLSDSLSLFLSLSNRKVYILVTPLPRSSSTKPFLTFLPCGNIWVLNKVFLMSVVPEEGVYRIYAPKVDVHVFQFGSCWTGIDSQADLHYQEITLYTAVILVSGRSKNNRDSAGMLMAILLRTVY